jgi:hypothetical protein
MDVVADSASRLDHRCRMTLQAMANCRSDVANGKSKPRILDVIGC